jgi:hypothetical protein
MLTYHFSSFRHWHLVQLQSTQCRAEHTAQQRKAAHNTMQIQRVMSARSEGCSRGAAPAKIWDLGVQGSTGKPVDPEGQVPGRAIQVGVRALRANSPHTETMS